MSKFDDCSCFQTRSDSSAYSSVSVLKLMRQNFVAYENTASPLAFPTGRSTNKSLQRELCNIEVQCLIMVFFRFFFFYILCCWTGIELTVGVTSKKANAPCIEASSYLVPLADTEAMNNYQCNWTGTKVVISWWLKALLQLFMTEKRRCNFNGTWTSSVPTEDCVDIPFPFDALHLFKQIWF
jgi:hypothetical protein